MPRVRDKMVSREVTLQPGTGVVDAAKRMIQQEKGPLPIVEGERPVAIVTDRDIIAHVVAEGRNPKSITVDDIASHELVIIGTEQDVEEARKRSSARKVGGCARYHRGEKGRGSGLLDARPAPLAPH
jgi:CBS domain-containing protein